MADYTYYAPQLGATEGLLVREADGAGVPCDLSNGDYQAFLVWLSEGNSAPEGWTGPRNTSPG